MINNFSDLSANERTYLAWIRTAIAMMAFGFIIEKFELFLNVIGYEVHLKNQLQSSNAIQGIGLIMMSISVLIMIGATVRYIRQARYINSTTERQFAATGISFMLALLVIIISLFLVGYVGIRLFQ